MPFGFKYQTVLPTLITGLTHQTWLRITFDIFQHLSSPSEKQAFGTSQACKKKVLYILELAEKESEMVLSKKNVGVDLTGDHCSYVSSDFFV